MPLLMPQKAPASTSPLNGQTYKILAAPPGRKDILIFDTPSPAMRELGS